LFDFKERLEKKITPSHFKWYLLGKSVIAFALGALLSKDFIILGLAFVFLGLIFVFNYVHDNFMAWKTNKKLKFKSHVIGLIGLVFLVFFLGLQSPQTPFKEYILLVGVLLLVPGLIDMVKKKHKKTKPKHFDVNIAIAALVIVTLFAFVGFLFNPLSEPEQTVDLTPEEEDSGIQTLSDGTKYLVHPSKIRGGGPPKDGIPSIDNPKFVTVEQATWIKDNELVLALSYKGVERVYPLQILVWHEIVNDVVAGDPLLITYCPLCGSGIAFDRTFDGKAVEFGTSGKLYNSNLVMYDRATDTYWVQIGGLAILGELTGQKLTPISIDTVVWRDWKVSHPNAQVLSQETGYIRAYGIDPYGSYYEDSFLLFPVENSDDRVHAKTVVFGIEVNGVYKAYMEDTLIQTPIIDDEVNGVKLQVTRSQDGVVKITNTETNEEIVKERDFWFAWYAFHPDTGLYGK